MSYSDGSIFIGQFRDDEIYGGGTFTDAEGNTFTSKVPSPHIII